jgi:hypothetical protein
MSNNDRPFRNVMADIRSYPYLYAPGDGGSTPCRKGHFAQDDMVGPMVATKPTTTENRHRCSNDRNRFIVTRSADSSA